MMAVKQYVVIGLGRFGTSVARRLHAAGQEVLGIDINEECINNAEPYITHGVIADATEEKALTALEIINVDTVILAIGDDVQSSILTAMLLKNLGVKKTIAKAISKRHGQVLESIGVPIIIYPERDMGERVANQLLSPNMLDYIKLSKNYNIEEMRIPQKMIGKSLKQLNIRAKYNVSVLAYIRDEEIYVSPDADEILRQEDVLLVIGNTEDLVKFSQL